MQASHYTIAAHRLVVLAEVNTVSQNRGNFLFKLSLAEALEEVATSITEEAWLYNEYAFYICLNNIHISVLFLFFMIFLCILHGNDSTRMFRVQNRSTSMLEIVPKDDEEGEDGEDSEKD